MSSAKAALESDTRVSLHFFSTYAFLIINCHIFLASLMCFFVCKYVDSFRCLLLKRVENTKSESTAYLLVPWSFL
jgi:hypothetical protein